MVLVLFTSHQLLVKMITKLVENMDFHLFNLLKMTEHFQKKLVSLLANLLKMLINSLLMTSKSQASS